MVVPARDTYSAVEATDRTREFGTPYAFPSHGNRHPGSPRAPRKMEEKKETIVRILVGGILVCRDLAFFDGVAKGDSILWLGARLGFTFGALLFCLPALLFLAASFSDKQAFAASAIRNPARFSGAGIAFVGSSIALTAATVTALSIGFGVATLGAWVLVRARLLPVAAAAASDGAGAGFEPPPRRWVAGLALLGLLTFLSVPIGCTKESAYRAAMKSDLRNLAEAEEVIFARSGSYSTAPGDLFTPSSFVIGPRVALTEDGWVARVGHGATPITCAMYVGSTPIEPATVPLVVACAPQLRRARVASGRALLASGLFLAAMGVWFLRRAGGSARIAARH